MKKSNSSSSFDSIFLSLAFCVCAIGAPDALAADRKNILFESSFESGKIRPVSEVTDGWFVSAISEDHAKISQTVAREAGHSIKLFIDKALDYSAVNGSGKDKPRVNISKYPLKFDYDTDYWIGWSVYMPGNWVNDYTTNWTTIMQLKQPIGGSPILSLNIKGDTWEFINRRDQVNNTFSSSTTDISVLFRDTTRLDKGRWVDFVIQVRLCELEGCDGILNIWKDGEKIVNQIGRNAYKRSPADGGPFLTLNLYKSGWKRKDSKVTTRELYLDAIRIGGENSDYVSVAPDDSNVGTDVTTPAPPRFTDSSTGF